MLYRPALATNFVTSFTQPPQPLKGPIADPAQLCLSSPFAHSALFINLNCTSSLANRHRFRLDFPDSLFFAFALRPPPCFLVPLPTRPAAAPRFSFSQASVRPAPQLPVANPPVFTRFDLAVIRCKALECPRAERLRRSHRFGAKQSRIDRG